MTDPGIVVQIHIPRCAGTSVWNWMMKGAERGEVAGFKSAYRPNAVFETDDDLVAEGMADPRVSTMSSHSIRRFPPVFHRRRVYYFTLLRKPVHQFLSATRYMLQEREAFALPPELRTAEAVAEWLLSRPLDAPFRENTQTNHLALYTWCDQQGGRLDPRDYARWSADDHHAYWNARVGVARSVLASCLAYGVLERLKPTLQTLCDRAAIVGIRMPPVASLGHLNGTAEPDYDLAWLDKKHPLGKRVRASLEADRELYRFVRAQFGGAKRNGGARKAEVS